MENTDRYITALINGNDAIIKEIYSKIYPKVHAFIQSNKGNTDDALDVFHDALMYIIVTQKEKRSIILSFEAYLFVICKNIWKKNLKNKVIKTDILTLEEKETNLSAFILEQQCFEFYIAKFNLLSENCKDILSSYFNGLSYEEITEANDYATVNTVRQRVFKCRTKLMELIKGDKEFQKIIKWGTN
ncbi:RNA polymerase sigma factor [Flavobacterium sp. J27]|uniref:RNA polymerase sigma factor n=1 Tax=Flavobacterium sp. J27 TaxID=2060419 RepID=UPI0010308E83|nr:sigma-70 family RNA polymerase sigma factor [Flavobacterium sp. J27]